MHRALGICLTATIAVSAWVAVSEIQRGLQRARRAEQTAAEQAALAARLGQRLQEREAELRWRGEELRSELEQSKRLGEYLAAANSRIEELQGALERRHSELNDPMPRLVRETLADLSDFLVDAGRGDLRFLRATRLEDHALHDVELVRRAPDGFGATTFFAASARFELDRATSELRILLSDGEAYGDEAGPFGTDGRQLVVGDLEATDWEHAFPLLITAVGETPPEAAEADPPVGLQSIRDWERRLDRLLGAAVGTERWNVERISGLVDSGFERIVLVGRDGNRILTRSLQAAYASIEIDSETETVNLLVRSGALRRRAASTPISEAGMRIPLPGVTPASAEAEMLGYVEVR